MTGLTIAFCLLVLSSSAKGTAPAPSADGAHGNLVAVVAGDAARRENPSCGLFQPGADTASASDCLACHQAGRGVPVMRSSHPVGLEYAAAQLANPNNLRPVAEVIRRGVLLPDGKLQCVTCHDAASPWASHVALPPGSVATPAVDPRAPATYLGAKSWRLADPRDPPPPPGSAVTPSPFCAACHTLAD